MKESQFNNPSWNFKLDKVNTYAFCHKVFTPKECQLIIDIAKNKGLIKGETPGENKVRNSKVSWLYPSHGMSWVFSRVTDVVMNLNERFFNFNLFGFNEGFQFTNYVAPGNKYGKHTDRGLDIPVRKLSLSIQLTDPKEYKGGELYLYDAEKGTRHFNFISILYLA